MICRQRTLTTRAALDFTGLFAFELPPSEIIFRGSVVYRFLLLVLRLVVSRDPGSADVLLIVSVSDAARNAIAGGDTTLSEGLLLGSTIIAWNLALN